MKIKLSLQNPRISQSLLKYFAENPAKHNVGTMLKISQNKSYKNTKIQKYKNKRAFFLVIT